MTRTPTPVNLTLELARTNGSRASQVAHALIEAIAGGQLHDGDRLPSTRTLAATFGLARSAVVAAYEELTAAGFLAARAGGSTYVEHGAAAAARAGAFGAPLPSPERLVQGIQQAPAQAHPIRYDLRPGQADPELISERDWTRAMRLATAQARQPEETTGLRSGRLTRTSHAELREQLGGHLRRARGLAADPEDIFLFPSVSSALRAVAVSCGLAGQPVAFEDPGYAKARLALGQVGAVIRPCRSTTTASGPKTCSGTTGPATSRPPTSSRWAAGCRPPAGPACWTGPGPATPWCSRTTTTGSSATTSRR